MNNKTLAKFFYEQCAGTTSGHMAMVPNNPTLFALISATGDLSDSCYATTQTEFASFLREMAEALDG